jgi:leucyl aminopeptidase
MFLTKNNLDVHDVQGALLVGVFQEDKTPKGVVEEIDNAMESQITELFRNEDISAKFKKVTKIHTLGKIGAKQVYFVGLGKRDELTYTRVRDAFGRAVQQLNQDGKDEASVALDSFKVEAFSIEQLAHGLAEAVITASYKFNNYKEKSNKPAKVLSSVIVYSEQAMESVSNALLSGEAYGAGTNTARTLVNIPGNLLTPTDLAEQAVEIAAKYDFEYEVLEREDMEKLGMGALLAVSQGSDQPPKMIVVKYQGRDKWDNILSVVGKGLTFDAGGYSLKPAANMHKMKSDMGGSAAVFGAMETIGRLKPEVNILFVIPSSENLVNGSAMKPGDVITSMSGKTIEVVNTDAEGRLILADAITYAKQLGADYIVDLATLTGGVGVALGDCTTGAMTNDDDFYEQIRTASDRAGELMWQLPSFEPYRDMVRGSDVADLINSAGRLAHPITGGMFVGEFAEDTPWIHLDVAATAYKDKGSDLGPKGGTGVMVRTLVELARNFNK